MKRPAKLLFAACLTTIIAAGSSTTPAAESDSPAQVLVQVDIPDQAMAAYWTRLPDAYGLRVVLDQPQPASSTSGEVQRPSDANVDEALTRSDRSSFFIGTTIENLRGLNPTFSCRTLTSVDGRRAVSKQQLAPAHPDQPYYFPYQSADPTRYKDPRVDVWLLQADGTQVMGAAYSCKYARVDPAKPRRHLEVLYEFPLASIDQAVAAAIRIDDRYFIEKLNRRE